jgi:Rieske Fe-S protein
MGDEGNTRGNTLYYHSSLRRSRTPCATPTFCTASTFCKGSQAPRHDSCRRRSCSAGSIWCGAMNLSHLAQQMTQAQINRERAPTPASLTSGNVHTPHPTHSTNKGTQPTPTTNHASTAPSRLDPTPTPKVQPTSQPPSPTPTPAHTGVVIGYSSQPGNSANDFINPADGSASTLIHLPNNNFAAYETACTHQGVPVHYNPATHKLVCPKHGAIFDPANAGRVLQGPARRPLPSVAIRVNGDGTITTG